MSTEQCSTSWWEVLKALPDPRARRGRRYRWATLLLVISAALASGERTVAALAQWIAEHAAQWQAWVSTPGGRVPSAATIRRVLRTVDLVTLEAQVAAFTSQGLPCSAAAAQDGRRPLGPVEPMALRGVAVDGKAVRGAQRHGAPLHLVSAVTHEQAQVLGHCAVADKSHEIPAVRALLRGRDLRGWVVTLDAMHTQRETAELLLAHGGHYLMVGKDHQPDLFVSLREWFAEPAWAEEQEAQVTTSGKAHGRLERRTLTCRALAPREQLDWPGAQQALLRVCWARDLATGQERQAVTYGVTSLARTQPSVAQVEAWWRGHGRIENQLHYVRDVTCGEDAGQAAVGATPHVLATLRNGLLSLFRRHGHTNMAATFRHLGASVSRTLAFLGCPRPAT